MRDFRPVLKFGVGELVSYRMYDGTWSRLHYVRKYLWEDNRWIYYVGDNWFEENELRGERYGR